MRRDRRWPAPRRRFPKRLVALWQYPSALSSCQWRRRRASGLVRLAAYERDVETGLVALVAFGILHLAVAIEADRSRGELFLLRDDLAPELAVRVGDGELEEFGRFWDQSS